MLKGLVAALTMVPVPGTNPARPYSITHGPAGLGLVHDKLADVANGVAVSAVGVKHCESTLTSSITQISPPAFFLTKAM